MKNIDWHLIPDFIRFRMFEQTKRYGVRTAIVITGLKIAFTFVALGMVGLSFGPMFAPATVTEDDKPRNAPSYADVHYRQAASQLCGVYTDVAKVVPSGEGIVAGHVIVVRLDGVMERMDTSAAWDRAESRTTADDIWVIGVCQGDIIEEARAA